jgi:hypothetical protein
VLLTFHQILPRPQVDTHIHHSACMHQKHLLRFIKSKLRKEPDEVVIFRDGKYLTLKEVRGSQGFILLGMARAMSYMYLQFVAKEIFLDMVINAVCVRFLPTLYICMYMLCVCLL